jgi:ABC-type branched-subunit amino acid transport system substrate-binding protein
MDSKILAYLIVALLVGSTVGYLANQILSEPKITALQTTVDNLSDDVANLTASLDTLKSQNTVLQESVRSLSNQSLVNKTVRIGYLEYLSQSPWTSYMNSAESFIKEIIEPDINKYASKLGYDLRFEFVVETVTDEPYEAGDITFSRKFAELKSEGIDLVIPGNGGFGVDVGLSYAAAHGMVLVSATSEQPDFAQGYRTTLPLFRLCPVWSYKGSSLADLMWADGVRTVFILQPGDSWGDGIFNDFEAEWWSLGGVAVGEKVRYEAATTDFSAYLQLLDDKVALALQQNGGLNDTVGLLALCRGEAPLVVKQAESYSNLFKITWYGADYTANSTQLAEQAGPQAARVKWISLKPETPKSDSYLSLSSMYLSLTGQQIDIYSAYLYDSAFLLAKSVIEAQSADGSKVGVVFQEVCNSTFGVTGWCGLNLNRDRIPPPYEIWSYARTASNTTAPILVGTLDPAHTHKQPITDSDMAYIVNDALLIAISPTMPDYIELTRNRDYVVLSNRNMNESWVPLNVGGYKVVLMTPGEIQAKADSEGGFFFLCFDKLDVVDGHVMLEIDNFPIMPSGSTLVSPSYGGVLGFEYVRSLGSWVIRSSFVVEK